MAQLLARRTALPACTRKQAVPSLPARKAVIAAAENKAQVIQPINGDPFVGMLETPITSSPAVTTVLSGLPAYRTAVAPVLRGVEIGLAHGYFLPGPFIYLGPLRSVPETAEIAGCLSAAGLVIILTACLSIYGGAAFQGENKLATKTLSGRTLKPDPWKSRQGWAEFTAGWAVGGLSGVAWCYLMTQLLPYYVNPNL